MPTTSARSRGRVAGVPPVHQYPARQGAAGEVRDQPVDRPQQGRLAGAGPADRPGPARPPGTLKSRPAGPARLRRRTSLSPGRTRSCGHPLRRRRTAVRRARAASPTRMPTAGTQRHRWHDQRTGQHEPRDTSGRRPRSSAAAATPRTPRQPLGQRPRIRPVPRTRDPLAPSHRADRQRRRRPRAAAGRARAMASVSSAVGAGRIQQPKQQQHRGESAAGARGTWRFGRSRGSPSRRRARPTCPERPPAPASPSYGQEPAGAAAQPARGADPAGVGHQLRSERQRHHAGHADLVEGPGQRLEQPPRAGQCVGRTDAAQHRRRAAARRTAR